MEAVQGVRLSTLVEKRLCMKRELRDSRLRLRLRSLKTKEEERGALSCLSRSVSAAPAGDISSLQSVTWVEKDNGSKTAQLRLIHLHVPHL